MSTHVKNGWGWYIGVNVFAIAIVVGSARFTNNLPALVHAYTGLLIAMFSGFLGATFSMLIQSQRRAAVGTLEDLVAAGNWYSLAVRGAVGLGAAVILYFFFKSGLLEGSLWPNLGELGFAAVKDGPGLYVPNQNWCLLVIWCFIGGFSETFVPSILNKTEDKGSTA
jgi:hypothetical protein